MLRPMVHLLVTALLVLTSTADRPGDGQVPDLINAHYRRPILDPVESFGNLVDEALRDSERESLDWADQNVGSPYLGHFGIENDEEQFGDDEHFGDDERHGLRKVTERRKGVKAELYGGFRPHRGTHNVTEGDDDVESSSLVKQRVHVAARPHISVKKYVQYSTDSYTITRVAASDLQTNRSDSGYVRILHGGVGSNYVALQLRSKHGKGLEYFIQVWGRDHRDE